MWLGWGTVAAACIVSATQHPLGFFLWTCGVVLLIICCITSAFRDDERQGVEEFKRALGATSGAVRSIVTAYDYLLDRTGKDSGNLARLKLVAERYLETRSQQLQAAPVRDSREVRLTPCCLDFSV
jgi:hypothetical protein